jgi:hypothetical protein
MSEHGGTNTNSNSNNPQNGAGRPLPKKEADMFKNLVKQYEMKQYKKAIKHADAILKKFPKHGETLAMKGLTYNYMTGHTREEAHALVKEGLKHDMRYVITNVCVCVTRTKATTSDLTSCITLLDKFPFRSMDFSFVSFHWCCGKNI